jgi:hypothetical protein
MRPAKPPQIAASTFTAYRQVDDRSRAKSSATENGSFDAAASSFLDERILSFPSCAARSGGDHIGASLPCATLSESYLDVEQLLCEGGVLARRIVHGQ